MNVKPAGGVNGVTEPVKPTKVCTSAPITLLYENGVIVPTAPLRARTPPNGQTAVAVAGRVNWIVQPLMGAAVVLVMVRVAVKPGL